MSFVQKCPEMAENLIFELVQFNFNRLRANVSKIGTQLIGIWIAFRLLIKNNHHS